MVVGGGAAAEKVDYALSVVVAVLRAFHFSMTVVMVENRTCIPLQHDCVDGGEQNVTDESTATTSE